ncbi:GNAT family N-acetyltransferase [Pseudonocardia nigra]|uniref:GNAT family N-acetyltransferase n=1 Tax=Pseudonocardia nigra TaxID=1921578 RepID=UPI001C5D9B3F|nr:GNAT family N-acetyltransferase [Pseudonocardia nigra]
MGREVNASEEPEGGAASVSSYRLQQQDDGSAVVLAGEGRSGRLHIGPRELPYGQTSTIRYAEIRELWVHESCRRRGIGGELVRRALAWARAEGYERIAVEASARPDRPALPFYEALGFTRRSVVLDLGLSDVSGAPVDGAGSGDQAGEERS